MIENIFYEVNEKIVASKHRKVLRPIGNLIAMSGITYQWKNGITEAQELFVMWTYTLNKNEI